MKLGEVGGEAEGADWERLKLGRAEGEGLERLNTDREKLEEGDLERGRTGEGGEEGLRWSG